MTTPRNRGPKTLGFLGPQGTFTEGAARRYAAARPFLPPPETAGDPPDSETPPPEGQGGWRLRAYSDIVQLLKATAHGIVDEAVVPIENSIEGTISLTLDTLVHDVDVTVVADIVMPIRHHLLVRPGVDWRQAAAVASHPQALAQCRRWLAAHLPGVPLHATLSTAAAAAHVGDPSAAVPGVPMAAIGNDLSAQLYGLHIAVEDIQDEATNETRFFVATGHAHPPSIPPRVPEPPRYKTSVAFDFPTDGPGNLYGALGQFARRRINLTKLESRPARRQLGHYIFFVDLEGHAQDEHVAAALTAIEADCSFLKVLGSYVTIPL